MVETMNMAIVELESTVEERIQARKRLVAALAAMLGEEIMEKRTLLAYGKESDVNGARPEGKTERSEQ